MSIVLIDKEGECDIFENFEYMGLSRDKWINRIGKIIYRYFQIGRASCRERV